MTDEEQLLNDMAASLLADDVLDQALESIVRQGRVNSRVYLEGDKIKVRILPDETV